MMRGSFLTAMTPRNASEMAQHRSDLAIQGARAMGTALGAVGFVVFFWLWRTLHHMPCRQALVQVVRSAVRSTDGQRQATAAGYLRSP